MSGTEGADGLDLFWAVIDRQLAMARQASTVADVLAIFKVDDHNSPAFFGGSGGDTGLDEALLAAGWRYAWSAAGYHWSMRAPEGGGGITYVEGDIFGEVERPPR